MQYFNIYEMEFPLLVKFMIMISNFHNRWRKMLPTSTRSVEHGEYPDEYWKARNIKSILKLFYI